MRLHRAAALFALVGVAAAFGCSLIANYDGFDTGSTATDAGAKGCGKPIPASTPNAPGGGDIELVGVANTIRFTSPDGKPYGYDLDDRCTCPGKDSCSNVTVGPDRPCDLEAGIDNSLGPIVQGFGNADELSRRAQAGEHGLLVRMGLYNGKSDDADVEVTLYNVAGFETGAGAKFDGTDRVIVDDNSLLGQTATPNLVGSYKSDSAYVTNGTIVAHFATFPLRLSVPTAGFGSGEGGTSASSIVAFPLSDAYFIGKMGSTTGMLTVTAGQLVGRVAVGSIVEQIQAFGICDDLLVNLKQSLCDGGLDISSQAKFDNTGRACDAVSGAVGITLVGATLTGHRKLAGPASRCDGGQVPSSCP